MNITPHTIQEIGAIFLLGFAGFCIAMVLTPFYTYLAYRFKFWKRSRQTSTTGELLSVISKLRKKRKLPTMAGFVTLLAVCIVTVIFNLDREQTWLPLAALIGGGVVGLIDDIINVRGRGEGVAGLRAPIKFAMITTVAAGCAWFFFYKLG